MGQCRSVVRFFGALVAGCLAPLVQCQTEVSSLIVDPLSFSLAAFPGFSITNPGPPTEVFGVLTVRSATGALEVTLRSKIFRVAGGPSMMPQGSVLVDRYDVGNTEAGALLVREQRFAGGAHEFCLSVESASGAEPSDPLCERETVEEGLWIDLVEPWDGDTIDETRPFLSWTTFGTSAIPTGVDMRLVLAASDKGKARDVNMNVPTFSIDGLTSRIVPFPGSQPDLQRGRCYAWQVEAWKGNSLLERTEPWRFCVKQDHAPPPEKYVLLRTDGGRSTYQVVDGFIYFRTDEHYATKAINCSIIAPNGERITPEVLRENNGSVAVGAMAAGVNLYQLDLQPYHLKSGTYTLQVLDQNGRRFSLRFNYTK